MTAHPRNKGKIEKEKTFLLFFFSLFFFGSKCLLFLATSASGFGS